MKLYRHYKNKPYRYIGTAKHSETLEDVVIYECLYENDLGKHWVRPKDMFFSDVEVSGQKTPRFRPIPLKIDTVTEIEEKHRRLIAPVAEAVFGEPWNEAWFQARFRNHTKYCLHVASVDGRAIAYKLGYELDDRTFYSWEGGVLSEFRRLGVASALMKAQHEWCRAQGYKKIETKSQNRFKEMLILNLKSGFEVIGTHLAEKDKIKIILEKNL